MSGWYDRRVLPELIGCACRSRAITRQRARLVPEAQGEVLEVGVGGGANLRFYDPAKVRAVHGVDPSPELRAKAEAAPRRAGLSIGVQAGRAEALPFADARFDTAVATFTLCSVADPQAALAEVRRVLKPGGRLLFCEHGLAPERRIARWQRRLEPAWSSMAGGCRLTRDIPAEILAAGFRFERLEQRYLRRTPKLAGWVSTGAATPEVTSVAGADWLDWPHVRAVLAALEAEGGPDCARFVGGSVRNTLLGRPVDEVDLATRLRPEQTAAALERAGLKAVPTGVEHGTITAVAHGRPVEVTTLRRDVETDGRRAVVAFTADWAEDARRRDFRLNALYASPAGEVFDLVGGGVEDAFAGRIIFVGDPETRIREDYLRILRFFRFGAWYGRDWPDPAGLSACARLKEGLAQLSAERVGKELLKLLAAPDPSGAVRTMAETGVLDWVLPGWAGLERLARLASADPELRLAALLGTPEAALGAAARLGLSNVQRDRIAAALGKPPPMTLDARGARAWIHRCGAAVFADRLRLACAADAGCDPDRIAPLLALAAEWPVPAMPVTGADLQQAGMKPGPPLGEALRRLEQAWVDSDFTLDRQALLAQLAEWTQTSS